MEYNEVKGNVMAWNGEQCREAQWNVYNLNLKKEKFFVFPEFKAALFVD